MRTGIVVLAAGATTRLGEPKQLLQYREQNLLQRAVQAALASACAEVVVVLGANLAAINPTLESLPIHVVENEAWQQGMASSIFCGLQKLLEIDESIDSVMFILCDQPFVDAALLDQLLHKKEEAVQDSIVACTYAETVGTPVLFDKTYFPELLALTGQEGAKKLLYKYKTKVALVPFPLGAIDIDTASDYVALQRRRVR